MRGEGAGVEVFDAVFFDDGFDLISAEVEGAFVVDIAYGGVFGAADHDLFDLGAGEEGFIAEDFGIDGDFSEAEDDEAVRFDGIGDDFSATGLGVFVFAGEE